MPPSDIYNIRSLVTQNDLYVPKYNMEFMRFAAFKVAAPRLWNDLSETVKSANSAVSFKKLLKTHWCKQSFS